MPSHVSVVVPFLDVADCFGDCLASIQAQTFADFECVLVDDGSSDGSSQIAQDFADRDPRFRILTPAGGGLGPGPARNLGIDSGDSEFLAFVDSDDLLAPRALEQQVTALRQSGSDFAGSMVWRQSLTRGLERCWPHREPFANRRFGTSIRELPILVRDRMIWNKTYRRSFWDEGGYRFPAMLFEDWPVILAAHLDARAVDTLPEPSYVWRERPAGKSISVRGHQVANVRDRVTAAGMVLDLVDTRASVELRELVHSQLADVDLREIVQSAVVVPVEEQPQILDAARELAARIDPALVSLARPSLQRVYRAAREDDTATLLRAAEEQPWAAGPGAPSATDRLRRKRKAVTHKVASVTAPRPRRGTVIDSRITDLSMTYRIRVKFDPRIAGRVDVHARLGDLDLPTRQRAVGGDLLIDVTLDPIDVIAEGFGRRRLEMSVAAGPIRWEGPVTVSPEHTSGVRRGGFLAQPTWYDGLLGFERLGTPADLEVVEQAGAELLLRSGHSDGELVIEQPWPTLAWNLPLTDHQVSLDLVRLVTEDPADDPLNRTATRAVSVRRGTDIVPAWLFGPLPEKVVHQGRQIELLRGADGRAYVSHRPAKADS